MITVSLADDCTLTDYYEYIADRHGTHILIEGPAVDFSLTKLSLLSVSSEGETIYQADPIYKLEMLDKPLIATLDIGSVIPRYGIESGGNSYGIISLRDKIGVTLIKAQTVPKI